jgi:hypothetical protein
MEAALWWKMQRGCLTVTFAKTASGCTMDTGNMDKNQESIFMALLFGKKVIEKNLPPIHNCKSQN